MKHNNYGKRNYKRTDNQPTEISRTSDKLRASAFTLYKDFSSEDLYLPDGTAYRVALSLRRTETNQLRKFYTLIKEAEQISKTAGFEAGRDKLYTIVPIMAYAVAREYVDRDLYELIRVCVNSNKLKSEKDIKTFSKFFESIIAYRKEGKQK